MHKDSASFFVNSWMRIVAGILIFFPICIARTFSDADLWIDVPYVRAENPYCGHACASMLLQYWKEKGYPAGATELTQIIRELPCDRIRGVQASLLSSFFQSRGFQIFVFKGNLKDLHSHLLKGRPLIAGLGKSRKGVNHFVVVAGMEPGGQYVVLNDPGGRKMIKYPWKDFEREWARTGHWTLLVLPQAKTPLKGLPEFPGQ